MAMESTGLELQLNCDLYKYMKKKSYVKASLIYDNKPILTKQAAYLDSQGNLKLHFMDVNENDSATLCVQVFIQRRSFTEELVGTVKIRVSDLLSSSTNKEGYATYELVTLWSGKDGKSVCEVLYKLSARIICQP